MTKPDDATSRSREQALSSEAPAAPYPLSPLQQGMLFHWLLDRHSGTDVEQIVAELNETIDPPRLERAWQQVLMRFGTLRTAFRWEGLATPTQQIEAVAAIPFSVEDLRSTEAGARDARVAEFLRDDRRTGFALDIAPAMRVRLFQLADDHFRMVWSFHHILIDGRAFEIILNSVFAAYSGTAESGVVERDYREYAEWTNRQDPEKARGFWRNRLAGFSAPTPIPADHQPTDGVDRFGQRQVELPVLSTTRLRDLAMRESLSLNSILMGAWALLLSRYSGESDVVFGATKTTRRGTIDDADAIVGLFLATIPVRVTVDQELSVVDWLQRVRTDWVSLRGAEHLPLVDIRQASEVRSSAPLFESLVVYENYQFGTRLTAQGGAWANRRFQILEQTGLPLTILGYGDDALLLRIEYDARRFEMATIDRMLGHLTTVLDAWGENSAGPVFRTPMLTAAERLTILSDWNNTAREYPADVGLATLVETQVERTPNAPAVTFGSETLSYAELNGRANQLARELQRRGAGPDVLVGLSVERSAEMMVALLAIIKSGAAYVPLDPSFPADRISYMLGDSALNILVTQTSVLASLPPFGGVVLALDAPTWREHSTDNLNVPVTGEHLAVVIYTSGSTGRPKGVQIRRRALINLLWSMREWLALSAQDRLLAITTISFDIAGADVWLPWLVGAHTIVATREAAADGEQLRTLIDQHAITFLQATPITWRQLMEVKWTGKRDLQAVCTGEAMPSEVAAAIVPLVGRLWNLYGPTETTIWSTGVRVTEPAGRISIGRPVANTQCYILDAHQQLAPAGVIGELYIAGDGLARGYLNRPDLDVEKFLIDPFSTAAGARMYRTGDLARYLSDGTIECLGRTDHQVKIRGFRIELGEVEAVLRMCPGVSQAVVIAREDVPGEKRLVGYVVSDGASLEPSAMRAVLKQSLPEYMVPSALVTLDSIPLTANGKIDRRGLPVPDAAAIAETASVVAPRTHVEKQLGEIWEALFNVPHISVLDNFFDLGGHSILAVKMMARISRVFGKRLSLNALFESPTIAQLAKHIEDSGRMLGPHSLVSIQATGSRPPIFWIPGGAALGLFRLTNIVTRLGAEQPVYGLGSNHPGSLDNIESVEQRSKNYLELVRRVQPHGPYCFAGFCAGGRVAFEIAQQLSAAGEVVAFVGMIDCSFPNFPRGRVARLLVRAQRLRHQLRVAKAGGVGAIGFIRSRITKQPTNTPVGEVKHAPPGASSETGNSQDSDPGNERLLEATVVVFDRYEPKNFPGRISLFLSDDEAYGGVSKGLDARREWVRHAAKSELRTFAGGHLDLFGPESGFAIVLKSALDDALRLHGIETTAASE